MKSQQFFLVLSQARNQKLREKALDLHDLCYVSSVSLGDNKWLEKIQDMYMNRYKRLETEESIPVVSKDTKVGHNLTVKKRRPVIDSSSKEARRALMKTFGKARA